MGICGRHQRGQPPKALTPTDELLHELVLAGVGGRTVEEARRNISWSEFQAWMLYREKHGPLWHGLRLEQGFALVAHTVSATIPRKKGDKGWKFSDFMPQRTKVAQAEPVLTLQEAMELMR